MARPRVYESAAARQAAYIARRGEAFSVVLPADIASAFREYMARQLADGAGLNQSEVLAKLIAQQLLRKR